MSLEFQTEPIAALQARYRAAVHPLYDQIELMSGTAIRPSLDRAHVFDHDAGVRFIITRERRAADRTIALHISASIALDSPLADRIRIEAWEFARTTDHLRTMLGEIAADPALPLKMKLVAITGNGGIPHWEVDQES